MKKPPTQRRQVAFSTFEPPLWGSETHPWVIFNEDTVSIHPHKGSSHKIYYLQIPDWGWGAQLSRGGGQSSTWGHERAGQRGGQRAPITDKVDGAEVTKFLQA